jgi:hypothetical protein
MSSIFFVPYKSIVTITKNNMDLGAALLNKKLSQEQMSWLRV